MKYENLEKATAIAERIKSLNDIFKDLNSKNIRVSLTSQSLHLLSINMENDGDENVKKICQKFIDDLQAYYAERIKQSHAELELL